MLLLPKNHITLTSTYEIAKICHPLTTLGISLFSYVKAYHDNSRVHLTNQAEPCDYFFKNYSRYRNDGILQSDQDYASGYLLSHGLSKKEKILYDEMHKHFNIDHVLIIINKQVEYHEFIFFGSTPDNGKILNFYLNHLSLLNQFISYFKNHATQFITEAEKHRIMLPEKNTSQIYNHHPTSPHKLIEFKQQISKGNHPEQLFYFALSQRELECLPYLKSGQSSKEIGRQLGISHKTVENHWAKIKEKLNIKNRFELMQLQST